MRRYAQHHGFDGVYIDGNLGVLKGYGYDGRPNVPSGKDEDFARLGARNHHLFSKTLKAKQPNFGTWYNWGVPGIEWARSAGLTAMFGSGVKGDVGDENIKAATAWSTLGGASNAGKGIKIGIMDSGIDQTHPAFANTDLNMPPGYPICTSGHSEDCGYTNNKVIVARSYVRQIAGPSARGLDGFLLPDSLWFAEYNAESPARVRNGDTKRLCVIYSSVGAVIEYYTPTS